MIYTILVIVNLVTANQCLPRGIAWEVQTQLSGKAKHTHYREVLLSCAQENCAPDLFAVTPETGSFNTATDLAALPSMQMTT